MPVHEEDFQLFGQVPDAFGVEAICHGQVHLFDARVAVHKPLRPDDATVSLSGVHCPEKDQGFGYKLDARSRSGITNSLG